MEDGGEVKCLLGEIGRGQKQAINDLLPLGFFGGLSVEETAEVMSTSPATVKRSWSSERAFLHQEISGGSLDTRAVGADPASL